MLGIDFYFQLIRKYVVIFGSLFDNINITRTNEDGTTQAVIKVPLTYAPKDKVLVRLAQDPNIDRESAITLPTMAFEMGNPFYDPDRKLNTTNRLVAKSDDPNKMKYNFIAVPYNFPFSLYVYAKNAEDATKIVEQIYPWFTPDFTVSAHLIPEMGITHDIPITLHETMIQDEYEGEFTRRKSLIWSLNFTLKGYLYGPTREKPIIKFVETNFYSSLDSETVVGSVTIQPGLTANGDPTTVLSESIDPNEIWIDDDYGFVKIIE